MSLVLNDIPYTETVWRNMPNCLTEQYIMEMLRSGMSIIEIANHFELSYSRVSKIIDENLINKFVVIELQSKINVESDLDRFCWQYIYNNAKLGNDITHIINESSL